MAILGTLAAVLLPVAALLAAAPPSTEGRWSASDRGGEELHVSLQWGSTTFGHTFARSELRGLPGRDATSAASTPVSFRIEREAGAFALEGTFEAGDGSGRFTFRPNGGFVQALGSLGVRGAERATEHDLMLLAIGNATTATAREFTELDPGSLDLRGVVDLFVHGVTPGYVRSMRSLGLAGTNTAAGAVELRVHRVSAQYVRELEALGYGGLRRDQLLQMGIHGVSGEQIRGLERVGYRRLAPHQLVAMRLHAVTPEFIREMRGVGFGDISPEALVELRVHRISARYVRELEALGYRGVPRGQLLQMGIHGVTPAFIRQAREAGFRDLSPDALVRMKIFGIELRGAPGTGSRR